MKQTSHTSNCEYAALTHQGCIFLAKGAESYEPGHLRAVVHGKNYLVGPTEYKMVPPKRIRVLSVHS